MREISLAILLTISLPVMANASIISECGASSGHEYYFPGAIVPKDKTGWHKGAITQGQLILLIDDNKPRLIFRDAAGMVDTSTEGATTSIVGNKNGVLAVLVVWPGGAAEIYMFRLDNSGAGEVLFGTFKWGGVIQKGAIFHAGCRSPGGPR